MTSKTSTVMTMPTALLRRRRQLKTFASSSSTPQANSVGDDAEEIEDIPEDELLLPDEDWTVSRRRRRRISFFSFFFDAAACAAAVVFFALLGSAFPSKSPDGPALSFSCSLLLTRKHHAKQKLKTPILRQVPGGANDSLTSNTPLGRAVGGACDELEALAELERDAAVQAANLLKKLGYRGNLLDNPPPLPEKKKKATEE
jgi:hypothetical protein